MNILAYVGGTELFLILLSLAILTGVILAIAKTIKSERPTSTKVIWIAFLVLPYTAGIATIIFWIVYFANQKQETTT